MFRLAAMGRSAVGSFGSQVSRSVVPQGGATHGLFAGFGFSAIVAEGKCNMGLDTVELVMAVQEGFGITIPDTAATKMITVGDMHAFVTAELERVGRPAADSALIFDRLTLTIVRQLGVEPSEVIPGARFVKDLRAD
jgi:acyl carrier protein